MELDELRPQLLEILQEQPDRYWTTYSIWHRLQQRYPDSARRLEQEYGEGVGEGGGHQYRPTSYISLSLGQVPRLVDGTRKLHAVGLSVHGINASFDELALFRWIG